MTPEQAERIAERIEKRMAARGTAGWGEAWKSLMAEIRAALLAEPEATTDRTTGPTREQIATMVLRHASLRGDQTVRMRHSLDVADAILALFLTQADFDLHYENVAQGISDKHERLLADFREVWRVSKIIPSPEWYEKHVAPWLAPQEEPRRG